MRKVTFGLANSLDNFSAREDHSVDWLRWSSDVADIGKEFWTTIDTVLIGRRTYEVGVRLGSAVYPGVKNYVFSTTVTEAPGAEIVSGDPAAFVRELKQQEGKGICVMSGGALAAPLFEAGLIDEVGLNIHPILLGRGIPLFHAMTKPIELELLECRTLQKECVLVRYRVKK